LGIPHHVLVRLPVRISGVSGDRITSAVLAIEVDASHLTRWLFIILQDPFDENDYARCLGGWPKVTAALVEAPDKAEVALPESFKAAGPAYEILSDARTLADAPNGKRQIKISFDRFSRRHKSMPGQIPANLS
jgi:hypothetical protein